MAESRWWPLGAGLAVVVAALSPMLDGAAARSLTAHMVQHVLLLTAAPPLLVLGLARGAPSPRWLGPAVVVQTFVIVGWHVPALYDTAEANLAVHVAEHISLVAAGSLLWWAAGIGATRLRPVAVVALFVAGFPGIAVGSALMLAGHPWFQAYRDLADQQLAGAVMWAGAGAIYALASGAAMVRWMRREPA